MPNAAEKIIDGLLHKVSRDRTNAITTATQLFNFLSAEVGKGCKIILRDPNGKERQLLLDFIGKR